MIDTKSSLRKSQSELQVCMTELTTAESDDEYEACDCPDGQHFISCDFYLAGKLDQCSSEPRLECLSSIQEDADSFDDYTLSCPSPAVAEVPKLSTAEIRSRLHEMTELQEHLQVTEYCVKVTSLSARLAMEQCDRAFSALDHFITSYKDDLKPKPRRWK